MRQSSPLGWLGTVAALAMLATAFAWSPPAIAKCPERATCHGCGCKGGPGYRAPDGHCVGFVELTKVCGTPPETRCKFENAPGTGANHDCALGIKPSVTPVGD